MIQITTEAAMIDAVSLVTVLKKYTKEAPLTVISVNAYVGITEVTKKSNGDQY